MGQKTIKERVVMKEHKREKGIGKKSGLWMGACLAAFLAAAAVYLVLLQLEKQMLAGEKKEVVYRAVKEIPRGEIITKENIRDYFLEALIDQSLISEAAVRSQEELVGMQALTGIDAGAFLTLGMFVPVDTITKNMEEPVIAGFLAEDLYQVAGGVLRAGDRIHIYQTERELGICSLTWENIYVQQVFDAAGNQIGNDDADTAAQRINILLDKKDVERFYRNLEAGNLRVVKVWDR